MWTVLVLLSAALSCACEPRAAMIHSNQTYHFITRREALSNHDSIVPVTFKGHYACSGALVSPKMVLTAASCLKTGSAANYHIWTTKGSWRPNKFRLGKSYMAEKAIFESEEKNALGLLQLMKEAEDTTVMKWDLLGQIQPWLKKESATMSGWEEQPDSGTSEEEDNEYARASYAATADKSCPAAGGNPRLICLAPRNGKAKSFLGGSVVSQNVLIGVITDTADSTRLVCALVSPSANWLKANVNQASTDGISLRQRHRSVEQSQSNAGLRLHVNALIYVTIIMAGISIHTQTSLTYNFIF